jgi:hypothetical protein
LRVYSSARIARVPESGRLSWARDMTQMGEKINKYRTVVKELIWKTEEHE